METFYFYKISYFFVFGPPRHFYKICLLTFLEEKTLYYYNLRKL